MSNIFSKESYDLVNRIRNLSFVKGAHTESSNPINKHNFQNTISYNKNAGGYYMNVTLGKTNYKILVRVDRPNPKVEKSLKKLI